LALGSFDDARSGVFHQLDAGYTVPFSGQAIDFTHLGCGKDFHNVYTKVQIPPTAVGGWFRSGLQRRHSASPRHYSFSRLTSKFFASREKRTKNNNLGVAEHCCRQYLKYPSPTALGGISAFHMCLVKVGDAEILLLSLNVVTGKRSLISNIKL